MPGIFNAQLLKDIECILLNTELEYEDNKIPKTHGGNLSKTRSSILKHADNLFQINVLVLIKLLSQQ